ncbi:CCR4-Not complex subunit Not1 [Schizosaccharomyces japonicus yFS275]|uniref:CCR4-Not complex subunit Not1 n=1 Tax=Schizosaccharomyces japonicus (strain yFS275 / FY16936) TaxID=402676 RepID=B6K4N5_SCHJY|nr:CCR4-Not complex subunit Not1 [Schizosaccharomyces japonicus yFS275]EEB08442.1 CCR4-Not complex subunit Not1 [Schizosaccharomyces japonicus yFS275]
MKNQEQASEIKQKNTTTSVDSGQSGTLENKSNANDSKIESIVKAQILFLLSTLREDQYDAKLEQIRQLINHNAPGVYHHFLRRLIQSNSYRIFGSGKSTGGLATYKLLLDELKSLTKSWKLASRFSDAISGADSEVFEDFDIESFLRHFQFTLLERVNLLIGLTTSPKITIARKALALLKDDFDPLMKQLADPSACGSLEKADLETLKEGLFPEGQERIPVARIADFDAVVEKRMINSKPLVALFGTMKPAKATLKTMKEAITKKYQTTAMTESDVVYLLCSLVSISDYGHWDTSLIGKAIASSFEKLHWETILPLFDNPKFMITGTPSLLLFFSALQTGFKVRQKPLTLDFLWTLWKNPLSQLSLISHIILSSTSAFDINQFKITKIVLPDDADDLGEELRKYAQVYEKNNLNCLELVQILMRLLTEVVTYETSLFLNFVNQKSSAELLLLGTVQLPLPWNPIMESLAFQWTSEFFVKYDTHKFVFHRLSKLNPQFLSAFLRSMWIKDSSTISNILDISKEIGFTSHLVSFQPNRLALEVAALSAARGLLDFQAWLEKKLSEFQTADELNHFLVDVLDLLMTRTALEKAQSESPVVLPPISIETINLLLTTLMDNVSISEEVSEHIKDVQIACLQVYPRLFSLGHEHDDIVIASNKSNSFASDIEAEVESYYQGLYEKRITIGEIILTMQNLKKSKKARDFDVFACLQHSLFDEYRFFPDYPLEALALTAVLFGSLIQFELLSFVPLGVALRYVYQALLMPPESKMFRFGMQALIQFQEKLPKYINYCNLILGIPSLQLVSPDIYDSIKKLVGSNSTEPAASNVTAATNPTAPPLPKAPPAQQTPAMPAHTFESIKTPQLPPSPDGAEVQESVRDTILFAINNLSQLNFEEKLRDLKNNLKAPLRSWFSHYIVTQRVSREANYLSLYSKFLEELQDKELNQFVFCHTLQTVLDLLQVNKVLSPSEKTALKNLGSWLGNITLARDKPIRLTHISFKKLLLEGVDYGKIDRVLPFVCKVLEKAKESTVFKPPNPWLLGIIQLLVELYHFAEFKLNLKFEIEILLKNMDIPMESIEPSDLYRKHLVQKNYSTKETPTESYEQAALKTDADVIAQFITAAASHIVISDAAAQILGKPKAALRELMQLIIQHSVLEIITAVVRRSVAIASIATKSLVQKDFATEPSAPRVLSAARQMAKVLTGSLAMVTCREPVQILMVNNLRSLVLQNSEVVPNAVAQAIEELVNQNLFLVGSIIESIAAETAFAEIDQEVAPMIMERIRYREAGLNEPFLDRAGALNLQLNLPGILKLSSPLTPQQYALYESFDRLSMSTLMSNTGSFATPTTESRRESTDSVGNAYASSLEAELTNAALAYARKLLVIMGQIGQLATQYPFTSMQEVPADHKFHELIHQFLTGVASLEQPIADNVLLLCAQECCRVLLTHNESPFLLEVFTAILEYLCQASTKASINVSLYWNFSTDSEKLNLPVILSLIRFGILTSGEVDYDLARGIRSEQGNGPFTNFAIRFLMTVVGGENPMALPGNFMSSIRALYDAQGSFVDEVKNDYGDLLRSMNSSVATAAEVKKSIAGDKQLNDQIIIVFVSWVHLIRNVGADETTKAAFVYQLHKQGILSDPELSLQFFRCNLEAVLAAFLEAASVNVPDYCNVDAYALLLITVLKYTEASVNSKESASSKVVLFKKVMAIVIGVFAQMHNSMSEFVHQKTFFRLFSSILCLLDENKQYFSACNNELLSVFSEVVLAIQPTTFPAFSFAWLGLISHRCFMPRLLLSQKRKLEELYSDILISFLSFLGEQLEKPIRPQNKLLYNGFLRIMLVLLHDFPAFLTKYCFEVVSFVPPACTQLRNMILSAFPSELQLPDPFAQGLKVGRLPDISRAPAMSARLVDQIQTFSQANELTQAFSATRPMDAARKLLRSLTAVPNVKKICEWTNLFVLSFITHSLRDQSADHPPQFQPKSTECALLTALIRESNQQYRYYLLSALVNQLRYPSSHTYFASCCFLYLFKSSSNLPNELVIKEQMTTILLERIICNRPHPWGLLITFTELLKNNDYNFWTHPYIKRNDEIRGLFDSLYEHIRTPANAIATPTPVEEAK